MSSGAGSYFLPLCAEKVAPTSFSYLRGGLLRHISYSFLFLFLIAWRSSHQRPSHFPSGIWIANTKRKSPAIPGYPRAKSSIVLQQNGMSPFIITCKYSHHVIIEFTPFDGGAPVVFLISFTSRVVYTTLPFSFVFFQNPIRRFFFLKKAAFTGIFSSLPLIVVTLVKYFFFKKRKRRGRHIFSAGTITRESRASSTTRRSCCRCFSWAQSSFVRPTVNTCCHIYTWIFFFVCVPRPHLTSFPQLITSRALLIR